MPPKKVNGTYRFDDYPDFRPNLSPCDMFKLGSFGGTYWRPIYSSVVDKNLKNCLLYTSPSPRDATLSRMPSSA